MTKGNAETQLQIAIGTLLASVNDKSPSVCDQVECAIRKLSEKHPNQVLNSCSEFCKRVPKPNNDHSAAVLKLMENVCSEHIANIDGDTILMIIEFSLGVMIENVGYEPVIQLPASGVLVAIGRGHHIQVVEALLEKMQAGIVPHYMIPHTLGSLANTNPLAVVPYLKNILNIMLPLFGALRSDPLKQAFAFSLGCFSDALLEYISNADQVPDPTITLDNFHTELNMAFDILYTNWLFSREPKVSETVLNSLAAMYPVLSVEKVTQHTTKLIQTLLNLYKRSIDTYSITKCLSSVIKIASNVNGMLLEPLLPNILHTLSDLVCISADYAQPELLKSHSEVLRCYSCFALHFTDHTIDQLVIQLRNNNEKERIKALFVLTHLITYSEESVVQRKYKEIIKQLNEMLNENNIRIRKALVKIIVAFASKKVLTNVELNPDGPDKYLEVIIRMCRKQTGLKSNEINVEELNDIRLSAENTLFMLSTSVPELEANLWVLLMDSYLDTEYDEILVILLRCLTYLASKRESECCEEAFIRSLVLLSFPVSENSFRETFVLNFLKNLRVSKSEGYKSVWETKIMQLNKYINQNYENLTVNELDEWHDLLFDFFNLILDAVGDEMFNRTLIEKAGRQLKVYSNNRYIGPANEPPSKQIEKQFLLKTLAMLLCHIKDKELVLHTLDNILVHIKLTDYQDLHACGAAVGITSRAHIQIVLDKLSTLRKEILLKKSSKFFSFMKDAKHDLNLERLRYVIIYSYAEVCNEAPSDKILRVIESEILDFVVQELHAAKDFQIRKACLKAINSVADAMHPNRNTLHIRMNDRKKVLELVSAQIHLHNGSEYIELFPVIIPTITALIRLPLPLESDERRYLLKMLLENVFNASAIYCKIKINDSDFSFGDLKLVPFITRSFNELNVFLNEILLQNLTFETLEEVVGMLETFLGRKKPEQRLPACETLRMVLKTYLDEMKFGNFGQTGVLLARIVARCLDPVKKVRKIAMECLCLVLCIAARCEGFMKEHDKVLCNSMANIQKEIECDDAKLLFNLTVDLAHVICVNLPQFQLVAFVNGLIEGLVDVESSSAIGCAVVLMQTLKNRGGELQVATVNDVLERILGRLKMVNDVRTRNMVLRAVLNLATHHSKCVGAALVVSPLPFDRSICDCWAILSIDSTLVQDLLDQFKRILKQTPLYEQHSTNADIKIANLHTLQVISALHELFKNTQLKEICLQQFPELFSLLLVTLASYLGTQAPATSTKSSFIINRDILKLNPSKLALETFRLFLQCCQLTRMASGLLNFNDSEAEFLDLVGDLVENVCVEHNESLAWIVACLGPFIRAELEPQRVAVVAFFTHLIKHKANSETVLVENLLEMILDVQGDTCCAVRKIGLKGLGYAVECLSNDLISRHCNPILSVLMNSLDYHNVGNESAVILEGMLSFSKLLIALDSYKFSAFQVTAAVRIKPLLGQDDVELRRAAFRLFGDLGRSLNQDANLDAFKEQIQGNLVVLLLHLCDGDVGVVKACKYTLRMVGPYLESPKVNGMIQEHLIDEANLHYSDFIRDLIKIMAEEVQDLFPLFVMTSLSYFKSQWIEIRSNAALIAGLLYSQLNAENKTRVSLDTVCDRLMRLLNDENEEVRMRAIQAISYLFLS